MNFENLKAESANDLQIFKGDLVKASADSPLLNHKYLLELYSSRDVLRKLEYTYNELYKNKWLYYSGRAPAETYEETPFPLKVMKADLKVFFDADKDLNDQKYKIDYMRSKIEFIEKVIEEINRRSFHISNMIKTIKFENGELG